MGTALMLQHQHLAVPGANLENYMHTVHKIPVLTALKEKEIATHLRENENLDSARLLVMHNLRFVIKVARSYSGYGLPLGDLVQEGNVGLMKAVKRFDPTMNVRLISFAVHWIRAEIHEFILKNWKIVKVATTKAQRKLFFNLRSSKKRLGWFNQQQISDVAKDLGVTPKDVVEMEKRMSGTDIGFDLEPSGNDESVSYSPSQYLENNSVDPAQHLENQDWEDHTKQLFSQALATLDDRSKDIISRRWLSEPKATLQDLAKKYSISAERIRQLEAVAIKKIKGSVIAS
ncbi:MAG: RNA polymerase sigma factor RpoH [Thiotrichaceae bacterium]|nr:RNA polymerase sigma factor RpoH [Thiotrichaceae bacterium]